MRSGSAGNESEEKRAQDKHLEHHFFVKQIAIFLDKVRV
mgnify:CR=1 FL=1